DTTIEEKSCGVVFLSEDLSRFKVAGTVEKSSVRAEVSNFLCGGAIF
ncbi:GPI mannosyltransferase, partial [Trifolium medium]|nr:GPI mannosyltransferase [Trifolium medium]